MSGKGAASKRDVDATVVELAELRCRVVELECRCDVLERALRASGPRPLVRPTARIDDSKVGDVVHSPSVTLYRPEPKGPQA